MAAAGYLFNERVPSGILIAQAVGITTSVFLAGQNAAFSYATVPALLEAPAPLAARQWKKVFDLGKKVGPILAVAGTIATGYLASQQDTSSLPFKLNLAATIIFPSIIPYTLAFMKPTNNKLLSKADSLASTELSNKAAEAGVTQSETVHALLDKWATLNLARALITCVGALCAVWAAIDKREAVGFSKAALKTGANRMG
ncbi:uncharacterized protein BDR25DRAFT_307855 [Lindgomyces ingoldianus]|uniref:Uncharacterized protein n=1 Tax=Lindgomyces ingoldianus TaxID=673940 RepID=A0ACB6Q8H7_9PLEO|nr:uncharacterized protein BDR25DRAFT_307855 [Lindgomyces ingoldianus]KAF2463248.1 hypothetical protein BDR25DRAFT_307855 [Lindgomyces ingoldianus]